MWDIGLLNGLDSVFYLYVIYVLIFKCHKKSKIVNKFNNKFEKVKKIDFFNFVLDYHIMSFLHWIFYDFEFCVEVIA